MKERHDTKECGQDREYEGKEEGNEEGGQHREYEGREEGNDLMQGRVDVMESTAH